MRKTRAGGNSLGSVFTTLLAGVALVGAIAYLTYQTMSGPVASMSRVTKKTNADTQMLMTSKLIIAGAAGTDCDSDNFIEPAEWVATAAAKPTNGGRLPADLGLPPADPWGTPYGYCVWDVGTANDAGCGGAGQKRLTGSPAPTSGAMNLQTVLAVVSAGPDRAFDTTCYNYSASTDDATHSTTNLVQTASGKDDVVVRYTYNQASAATPMLWSLKTAAPDTATVGKTLEVGDVNNFNGTTGLISALSFDSTGVVNAGGGLQLADQASVTDCSVAADAGSMRYNTATPGLEFCDGSGWVAVGSSSSGGSSSSSGGPMIAGINNLADGIAEYDTLHIVALGENAMTGYEDGGGATGTGNTVVGQYAGMVLTTGSQNTALGYQALMTATTGGGNTALGYQSLKSVTSGNDNTAAGISALSSLQEASENTAAGYEALKLAGGLSGGDIAVVQTSPRVLNSDDITFDAMPAEGNAIIVYAMGYDTNDFTVSDNQDGSPYTMAAEGPHECWNGNFRTQIFYKTNVTISNPSDDFTVTVSNSGSDEKTLVAIEVSGLDPDSALDQTGTGTGLSEDTDTTVTADGSTTQNSELAVAGFASCYDDAIGSDDDIQPSLGWTNAMAQNERPINGGKTGGAFSYKILTSAEQPSVTWTHAQIATGGSNSAVLATFKAAPGGSVVIGAERNTAAGYRALKAVTSGSRNTAAGYQALKSLTSGSDNTAAGLNALSNAITTSGQTAFGRSALTSASTGTGLTAAGDLALAANLSGIENTALGYSALAAMIDGQDNTAVGSQALGGASSSHQMTAIGYQSLRNDNTLGSTALGYQAALTTDYGQGNTAIGVSALKLAEDVPGWAGVMAGNAVAGYAALSEGTRGNILNTAIGFKAGRTIENCCNVAAGYQALETLTTNNWGDGGYYETAIGYQALQSLTQNTGLLAIGYQAMKSGDDPAWNVAIGYQALADGVVLNNMQSSTAFGYQTLKGWERVGWSNEGNTNAFGSGAKAGVSSQTFGNAFGANADPANAWDTVAFGADALSATLPNQAWYYRPIAFGSGANSINNDGRHMAVGSHAQGSDGQSALSVGYRAGYSSLWGDLIVYGWKAGESVTDSSDCCGGAIALGAGALKGGSEPIASRYIGYMAGANDAGAHNVGVGAYAMFGQRDGWYNTVIGYNALGHSGNPGDPGDGDYNTALGANALANLTTGDDNTAAGADTLLSIKTGSKNTAAGYGAGPVDSPVTGGDTGDPISVVQLTGLHDDTASAGNSSSLSFGTLPTAGNTIIVTVTGTDTGGFDMPDVNGVTDNQGNTYVHVATGDSNTNARSHIYAAYDIVIPSPGLGFTVTINPTGTNNYTHWGAMEVAGLVTADAADVKGTQYSATAVSSITAKTSTPNSGIPAQNAELAVAVNVQSMTAAPSVPAPSFRAAGSFSGSANAPTPGMPTGWQPTDILVLLVETENQPIAAPSGWNEITNSPQGTGTAATAGSVSLQAFWRRAQAGDAAPTIADSGDHTTAQILAFKDVINAGNPIDISAGDVAAVASTSATVPAVTTTVPNALVVTAVATSRDAAGSAEFSAWTNGNLSGLTELTDNTSSAGNGGGFGAAAGTKVAAGGTGTTAATLANSQKQALLTFALKPSASIKPRLRAAGAAVNGTGDVTPTLPTGWQAGDLLLMFVETDNQTVTAPTGWSAVTNSPQGAASGGRITVFWRRAASGDTDPTIADPGNHAIAQILAFQNVAATGNPWDVTAGDTAASSVNVTMPAVTTTGANELIVMVAANGTDIATAQTSAWANANLESVNLLANSNTTAGNGGGFGVAAGVLAAAGSTGSATATLVGASVQGRLTIALKPASGACNMTASTGWTSAFSAEHCSPTGEGISAVYMNPTPTFVGATTATANQSGGISTAIPSGTAVGDLLILAISSDDGSTNYTWPSGFTQIEAGDITGPGDGQAYGVAWKVYDGTEGASVSMSGAGCCDGTTILAAYRGAVVNTSNTEVTTTDPGTYSNALTALPLTGSVDTTVANTKIVLIGTLGDDCGGASLSPNATWGQPAGYTSRLIAPQADGWAWIALADSNATFAGPGTVSVTGTVTEKCTDSRVSGTLIALSGGIPGKLGHTWSQNSAGTSHSNAVIATFKGVNTGTPPSGGPASAVSNNTCIGYGACASGVTKLTVGDNNKIRFGNDDVTTIAGQAGWTALSDRRLKKDIQDSDLALDFIMKLRPVSYRLVKGNDRLDYGFIAQDVEQALDGRVTNMITRENDEAKTYRLRAADILAPVVKALQQQEAASEKERQDIDMMKADLLRVEDSLGSAAP